MSSHDSTGPHIKLASPYKPKDTTYHLHQNPQDVDTGVELLVEAMRHAKLTQNLSLMRRIKSYLERIGAR